MAKQKNKPFNVSYAELFYPLLQVGDNKWYSYHPSYKNNEWWFDEASHWPRKRHTRVKLPKEEAMIQMALGLLPTTYFDPRYRTNHPIDIETMTFWIPK